MEREQMDRLLAEYATGGLTTEEKKVLFAAALEDQALFDQLMEEDALREAIELPGARDRLIDSLQEDLVMMPEMARSGAQFAAPSPVAAERSPKRGPATPTWLAWVAGIGVVLVSGAITYTLFDRSELAKMAEVRPWSAPRETKPFVAPPSAAGAPVAKPMVEEPPKIMARGATQIPAVNIPLPSAPPPALKDAEAVTLANARAEEKVAAAQAESQQAPGAPMPTLAPKRQAAPAAGGASVVLLDRAKKELEPPSVWRRTGDGVWTRVGLGETVRRGESVVVRYTVSVGGAVTLSDERGRQVARKNGRAGEELELAVPAGALATGNAVTLVVTEAGGGTARILLRLR